MNRARRRSALHVCSRREPASTASFAKAQRAARALALSLLLLLATTVAGSEEARGALLSETGPMSWRIEGEGASIYILGTFHLGIPGFDPLDADCLEAFDEADRLIAELSSEDYERSVPEFSRFLQASLLPGGASIESSLSEACKAAARDLLGEGTFSALVRFRPWVLSIAMIEATYLESGLEASTGSDSRLYDRAGERRVEGLDTLSKQLELLAEGSDEEQIASLEAAIPKFLDGSLVAETTALAASYAAGDRREVARLLATSIAEGISANPADAASYERLLQERNRAWARRLAAELDAGGRCFVFAGAAHFLGELSVFDELRAIGAIR